MMLNRLARDYRDNRLYKLLHPAELMRGWDFQQTVPMPEFEQLRDDISTLPETAQQLVVDFVDFLKQRYSHSQTSTPHPLNLENEPFVGMWSDHPEMQDSTVWVKKTRQQHWRT